MFLVSEFLAASLRNSAIVAKPRSQAALRRISKSSGSVRKPTVIVLGLLFEKSVSGNINSSSVDSINSRFTISSAIAISFAVAILAIEKLTNRNLRSQSYLTFGSIIFFVVDAIADSLLNNATA